MDTDYYEWLNVPQNASLRTIKSAYRKMVKSFHPDTHPGNPRAEVHMKKINAAYQVLKNSEKRKAYDRRRAAGASTHVCVDVTGAPAENAHGIICRMQALKKNPRAIHGVAYQAFKKDHYRYAAALLKQAIEIYPKNHQLYRDLASCFFELQAFAPCAQMLQKALKICPDDPDAWFNLAYVQELDGDLNSACQTLETSSKRFPRNAEFGQKIKHIKEKMKSAKVMQ